MIYWQEILIRLLLASFFGALIGIERERKDWAAGLRTHMMVCVGACLIMLVSAFGFSDILGTKDVTLDPSRIAAQVVSGIGFIGAGAILFVKGGIIRGLTTAAGLWTVAAIGLATGSGMYFAAAATTFIALVILLGLQPIERRLFKKFRHMQLRVIADTDTNHAELLKKLLNNENLKVQSFSLEKEDGNFVFQLSVENVDVSKLDVIVKLLKDEQTIKDVFWTQ
ncbi:MAG: MgtC/SapB family protein [Chitinophagales bacterium]|nr:MgtC/SapB family protein [Chitinophagales bacterium]